MRRLVRTAAHACRHMVAWVGVLGLPLLAGAQDIPVKVAGAGGRFETKLDSKSRIEGLSAPQVAAFRKRVDQLAQVLKAMPQVNTPPAPLCVRLGTWLDMGLTEGKATAEVSALIPINFQKGRCSPMTNTGVVLRLNALQDATSQPANLEEEMADGQYRAPPWKPNPVERQEGRLYILRDGTRVLTHGKASPWVPITTEQYLTEDIRRWKYALERQKKELAEVPGMDVKALLAPMQERLEAQTARLKALKPEQRRAQACADMGLDLVAVTDTCPPERQIVALNPAYRRAAPDAVDSIVVGGDAYSSQTESEQEYALRKSILDALNWKALGAVME